MAGRPGSPKAGANGARVCVIGAGSSGIVASKVLGQHGIAYDCFEKGSGIGGNWRFRNDNGVSAAYASLHINTSKTRMAYSDFPMPEDYPDYPHHSQILEYFEDYVDHFGVRQHIRFQTAVSDIAPDGEGWSVTTENGDTRHYSAVLVSNGHHWDPKLPDFPGTFDGHARHSHSYETSAGLEGKRVLVVGIGNSGVDIACETSRIAAKTFLSTRRSAHIVPKYVLGKPIDLYTSAASSHLPLTIQRLGFEALLHIASGSQENFGVPRPKHNLLQAHPTVSSDLLNLVGHGKIQIKPNIEELQGDRVAFADSSVESIDEIIYATGYRISFPFLSPELLNPRQNEVRLYRHVALPELPGLYFIGLIQPLGAIMPLAKQQSIWVAKLLSGEVSLPERDVMEKQIDADAEAMRRRYVASPRHTIQVDFYPYMAQLRKEMRRRRTGPIKAPLQPAAPATSGP